MTSLFGIKVCVFCDFLENDKTDLCQIFVQDLGENTLALKILHPTFKLTKLKLEILKGRVHCFSMQVVINKYFLLNPEKNLVQIRLVVFEKYL